MASREAIDAHWGGALVHVDAIRAELVGLHPLGARFADRGAAAGEEPDRAGRAQAPIGHVLSIAYVADRAVRAGLRPIAAAEAGKRALFGHVLASLALMSSS